MQYTSRSRINQRYEVVRVLGLGTTGTVVQVLDHSLDRQSFALKMLKTELLSDEAVRQRFHSEVTFSRQLAHPRIVRVFDLEQSDSELYLVMEYVAGCSLEDVRRSYPGGRVPTDEVVYLLAQIAEGLSFAHQKGVIHRDLKPQNILIDSSGSAKIGDFGIAHSLEASHGLTKTGQCPGTPAYMAPEQFSGGAVDPRADIYSFGVLAFELLTGRLPFEAENFYELGRLHLHEPLPSELLQQSGHPEWLTALIRDCTKKVAAERPPTMRAIGGRLSEHRSAAGEKSKSLLQTVVQQHSPNGQLLTREAGRLLLLFWLLAVWVAFTAAVLIENSSRMHVAARINAIDAALGTDSEFLLRGLGFARYRVNGPAREFACIQKGDEKQLEVLLLGAGRVNNKDHLGNNLIHYSVKRDVELLRVLHHHDADLNARNRLGQTALFLALQAGRSQHLVELLVEGGSPHIADKEGNVPLLWAVTHGDFAAVNSMLYPYFYDRARNTMKYNVMRTQRDPHGRTAVHIAAATLHADILDLLLKAKFDVHARDLQGRTALMLLVRQPVSVRSKTILALLRAAGVKAGARDDSGLTAADHARLAGNVEWLAVLGEPAPDGA